MFNPAELDPKTRKLIIQSMKDTRNNPVAMLKLRVLNSALEMKRYIESNYKSNLLDFRNVWEGFQNKTVQLFDEFENELLNKLESLDKSSE